MFDQDSLWTDVGYVIEEGELAPGKFVTLARTTETSPTFLEDHSAIDDLIQFHSFKNREEQTEWVVSSILRDIQDDELRPEDIVVINPDPLTTQKQVGPIRTSLFSHGINNELAGVSTSADVFTVSGNVMFTGIFRAKGNEAGMVYIINAQDCVYGWDKTATALARNRLFTAVTRSKAWVRILGVGPSMDVLVKEWKTLRDNDYKLRFRYPTQDEKKELRVINKELQSKGVSRRRRKTENQRTQLLEAIKRGEIDADQLISDVEKVRPTLSKQ